MVTHGRTSLGTPTTRAPYAAVRARSMGAQADSAAWLTIGGHGASPTSNRSSRQRTESRRIRQQRIATRRSRPTMNRSSIPLDPLNPGQFYACCGLIELFDLAGAQVQSRFAMSEDRPRTAEFQLSSDKDLDLHGLLTELRGAAFECLDHPEKAVKPIRLKLPSGEIILDWWFDCFRAKTVSIKCWAG